MKNLKTHVRNFLFRNWSLWQQSGRMKGHMKTK